MRINRADLVNGRLGFTVVEILIAVAIIGILAATVGPKFQGSKRAALYSEAKVNLAALYTVEQSLRLDFGTYTLCLRQIGFNPTSADPGGRRYYLVGVNAHHPSECAPTGNQDCDGFSWNKNGSIRSRCTVRDARFPAEARLNNSVIIPSTLGDLPAPVNLYWNRFIAGATGAVYEDERLWDRWTIDHNKNLIHMAPITAPNVVGSDEFFQEL